MKTQIQRYVKVCLLLLAMLGLNACGGSGSSNSGGGQEQVATTGPNLNGDTWRGSLQNSRGLFITISATVTHNDDQIVINTSIADNQLGGLFRGTITDLGTMLLFDAADGEDWTTLFGPVTTNSIDIADFVFINGIKIDTNTITLSR
jgi:hypothetical protein